MRCSREQCEHYSDRMAEAAQDEPYWSMCVECRNALHLWTEDIGPVGNGWRELVEETHRQLNEIDPLYQIDQIKEKFGELRFYYTSSIREPYIWGKMDTIVDNATQRSRTICEFCGEDGEHRTEGRYWFKTLCDNCNKR